MTPLAQTQPQWLQQLRQSALERAGATGLPTARLEAWRFGDLRRLHAAMAAEGPRLAKEVTSALIQSYLQPFAVHRFVFVDGVFAPSLSHLGALPVGCWLGTWSETLLHRPDVAEAAFSATDTRGARHFASINAAHFTDGIVLALEPGVVLSDAIELVEFTSSVAPTHLRHVVQLGAASQATLMETTLGVGGGMSNTVTSVALDPATALTHAKLQIAAETNVHLAEMRASLGEDAQLNSFFLTLGAQLSRQDIHVAMAGKAADLMLGGAYLLHGTQEASFVPVVDHQVAGCTTTEVFKGVLEESAHAIFLGTITVREGADQTEAHQQNHNLLTSKQARIDTRPELAIYADEVKCSHGATVGDLDENALFYLQARGIDPQSARQMLIGAFAEDAIERAALPEDIALWLTRHLHARLGRLEDVA